MALRLLKCIYNILFLFWEKTPFLVFFLWPWQIFRIKSSLRRKGFISSYYSMKGRRQGKDQSRGHGGILPACCRWLVQLAFLHDPGPPAQGMALPTAGWVLPTSIINQDNAPHRIACRSMLWMCLLSVEVLPSRWPSLCQVVKNLSSIQPIPNPLRQES